ncbi:hypothetical protein [Aquirufa nivalisilvae]
MSFNIRGAVNTFGGNVDEKLIKDFDSIEGFFVKNGLNRIKSKVLRIVTAECTQSVDGYLYGIVEKKILRNSCIPPRMLKIRNLEDFREYFDTNGILLTDLYPIVVSSEFYRKGKVNIGTYLDEYSKYQANRIVDVIQSKKIEKVVICSRYKGLQVKTDKFQIHLENELYGRNIVTPLVKFDGSLSGKGGYFKKEKFEEFINL